MKRAGVVLILLLAFAGLADSAYLAQHEANGTPLLCTVQNLSGCNIVASSQYSHIFGISLGELGVVFYSILFILAALELVIFNRLVRRVLQGVSLVGVLASLYFTFIQMFVIGAICIYCSTSAAIALFAFILATFIEPLRKNGKKNVPAPGVSSVSATAGPPKGSLSMPPAGIVPLRAVPLPPDAGPTS